MARPKLFDTQDALDSAIAVFREHGFEGSSAQMLVDAMGIGRQSLYDSFGDKWQLYCAAVRRYSLVELAAHSARLELGPKAVDGIEAMIGRVVDEADQPCLGVNSICEFGSREARLGEIRAEVGEQLRAVVARRVGESQDEGDVARELDPNEAAAFLLANIAGIRIAARQGADSRQLHALGQMAMRALT